MKSKFFLAVFMGLLAFAIISSCNKDERISNNTKSLKDNIFTKNADGNLFSYDIKKQTINNKEINIITKNEVIAIAKSSFSEKVKPFYYNFKDVDNLFKYINEGKVWFISNKIGVSPIKIKKSITLENRTGGRTSTVDCECEKQGSGNNFCEYDNSDGRDMCWTQSCIDCDFIVCPDPASICFHETHGGGIFVLGDSVVVTNSTSKYVLGQNTILKFEFLQNETICYREQFTNTIFNNGLYNLNIPNINNIENLDSLYFVSFEENTQFRTGHNAEPSCTDDSCVGDCELKTGSDGCQRCKCSGNDSSSGCSLVPNGLENGGVVLYAESLTIVDI